MPELEAPAPDESSDERDWLRVTLSSIGEGVITTDLDCCVTYVNPVAEKLTGWAFEEALGKPLESVFRIMREDTRQVGENPALRALRSGVVVGLANHTLLIHRDGTERPIDDSAAPIRDAQGSVSGVVLVFRDVSDRNRQEHLVEAARSYAESILATMREPFLVLDEHQRVVTANRAFCEAFRVSQTETVGQLLAELGDGQWNIPRLRVLLEEVLPQNHSFDGFEVEHDFPGVGMRFMRLNARRIGALDNESRLILVAIEDVTEQRRAQAVVLEGQRAMLESETRYRRLFESAKDGILILDFDTGRVTDVNPFMSTMLGYSANEFIGKELWQIGLFKDREASEQAVRELQQNSYIRYEHLPLESATGERIDVEIVANSYQEGDLKVIQCNIRDITERSILEIRMQEQAAVLADLDRRKDEFLAMLSHELRNPLAPISNAVLLMQMQGVEDPVQQGALGIMERQVMQLNHIVNDLLEIARISTGRIQLRPERVVFGDIVNRAVEAALPLIDQRKQVITVSLPPRPIVVQADPARLEQVVVNLLTNATKYTDHGGRITLSLEQEGKEATLRVRDTGIGIAPDLLPHIFQLFTQADRSLDRSQGGLGIGLALVQRLVELHHGRTEVTSVVGQGSEFVVRLPVVPMHVPLPAPLPPKKAPDGGSCRVMVVDDNIDLLESLALLLEHSGHVVQKISNGPAVQQAALDGRTQVILMDIGLPGLSGYDVAKRLRLEPSLKDIVLVAITGYSQQADRQQSIDAGFDYHLIKPADFEQIKEILGRVATKAN